MPEFEQVYLGIDPGASGGIAIVCQMERSRTTMAYNMPETESDTADILREYQQYAAITTCFIEAVHSMPKQGVASSFKFGRSYGFLRGLLIGLKIPFEEITPQTWQKEMNCRTGGDKNVSKAKAQQLWPELKITHALADALLLAECARRRHIKV